MIILMFCFIFANENSYYSEDQGVVFENTQDTNEKFNPFAEGRDLFYRPLDTFGLGQSSYSLEKYSLDEFQLQAVVWSIKNPIALFKGPDGSKYRLHKGDKIGRNNGVITNINNGQVEIQEIISGISQPTIVKIKKG